MPADSGTHTPDSATRPSVIPSPAASTAAVHPAPAAPPAPVGQPASPRPVASSVVAAGPDGAEWTAEVCRDPERFGELAPEWDALYRRSGPATPFQSHAWLHSWWLSYGTPGRLRLVLVRRDGVLVASAPLMLVRRPLPVLVLLGGGISDFCDVLIDDAWAEPAAAELAGALARTARAAVIDLREVRPGAAAERVRACWDGPSRRLTDSICLELPAVPMDELLGRLATARAQRARAKLRKIDAAGIDERVVQADRIPAAVEQLLTLHRRQWQGRGVTPEHLSTRFADHLTRSVAAMVGSGDARMTEFLLAGEVVAADLTLMSARLAGGYLYGADPELRNRKVDVAAILLRHGTRQINGSGRTTLSMLRGNEPYKHHWRPETVHNQRLLLARRALAPALGLLVAGAACRGGAASVVKRIRRSGGKG